MLIDSIFGINELTRVLNRPEIIGTLRLGDGDGNESVIRAIGLISKTTTLHVHHTFLYISLPFLRDYDVQMLNFMFNSKKATSKIFLFLC